MPRGGSSKRRSQGKGARLRFRNSRTPKQKQQRAAAFSREFIAQLNALKTEIQRETGCSDKEAFERALRRLTGQE
jgi:hypothetical protein